MSVTILLSKDDEARLQKLAARTGKSVDQQFQELVERSLEDAEDLLAALEVKERLDRGEEETISLEEMERRLGLAD